MRTKHWLLALALLAGAGPALAQSGPSFDCARAKEDAEKAICKSAGLSKLDRDIGAAYAEARRKLDPAGQKALKEDQDGFLMMRDTALTWPDASLEDHMKSRLAFLRSIRDGGPVAGDTAFLGEWKADYGSITIKRGKGGKLAIGIDTFAPVTARWVCEVGGEAAVRNGRLGFKEDDVTITLSRSGSVLKVEEKLPPDRRARDYCGANGSVEGTYFRVK